MRIITLYAPPVAERPGKEHEMNTVTICGEQFNEYQLERKQSPLILSVSPNGYANIGVALREHLGKNVRILATPDGQKMALATSEGGPFLVRKGGAVRATEFIRGLQAAGIPLPARYEFTRQDEWWIGTLIASKPVAPKPECAARKPRKKGLANMLPEGGCP